MSALILDSIEQYYGEFHAIKDVNLSIKSGEFIVMVGPSGCGKSTLLRSIAGLEKVTSGRMIIGDHDVTDNEPWERGVAMVFQNYALYPHMSVRENMGFALKVAGRTPNEVNKAVENAATILDISNHLDKKPKSLSGGQKQRVAIGRAITRSPKVFLFDEPLSNLDSALRSQMRVELGRLHKKLGATMVYVTHDQTEAMTMASRIVVLNNGVIEQVGTPLELYNRPNSLFVAGFLGSPKMNFFDAKVITKTDENVTISLKGLSKEIKLKLDEDAGGVDVGQSVRFGVRPETITIGGDIATKVAYVESLGNQTLLYLDGGGVSTLDSESSDGFIAVQLSKQHSYELGSELDISWSLDKCYLFNAAGRRICSPR